MGEDGTLQGLLEVLGVPYVGAGVLASALAMDKAKAKDVLAHHGLPQPRYRPLRDVAVDRETVRATARELGFPAFVKPANLGSSIGTSRVESLAELEAGIEVALTYDEWIVIEEAIVGREFEVGLVGNERVRVSVPGEVRHEAAFFDYEAKYGRTPSELVVPADLPSVTASHVQALAVTAFRALRAEGMARVDFLYEEGGRGPLVNEINTIPGFASFPKLWQATGVGPEELIHELVRLALERHERRRKVRRTDRLTTVRS